MRIAIRSGSDLGKAGDIPVEHTSWAALRNGMAWMVLLYMHFHGVFSDWESFMDCVGLGGGAWMVFHPDALIVLIRSAGGLNTPGYAGLEYQGPISSSFAFSGIAY